MKDKKKQGSQPTISLMFEGGIPFHEINNYSWALGLAIMGHAHESLEEALIAYEELLLLQSSFHPSPDISDNHGNETVFHARGQRELAVKARLAHLPVAAGVLWGIFQLHKESALARGALQKYYPALLDYQLQLYKDRDPQEDGLITNLHPWESFHGQADHWMSMMRRISNAGNQVADDQYPGEQLLHQLAQGKTPFEVQDPLFHAFLSWNNESLIQIGGALGEDVKDIMENYELTVYSINERLWDAHHKQFRPFDLKTKKHLPNHLLDSALCLFSEVATQDRAEELYTQLEKQLKKELEEKISPAELHPLAIADRILLLQGLGSYGFDELSVLLLQRLTFLLQKAGEQKENDFLTKGYLLFLNN